MERIAVRIPKGCSCVLCGGSPVTVITYSRMGRVTLDEPCVRRAMGRTYDGGPKKEALHDEDRTPGQERRVLALGVAVAAPPKPPDLASTIHAYNSAEWPRPARARASARIVDGGTKLGHIVAWRLWFWGRGELRGVGFPELWAGRAAIGAVCKKAHIRHATTIPVWGCTCGYHAMPPGPFKAFVWECQHDSRLSGRRFIIGTVALWGRVVTHQDGYRAQYAYPLQCFAEMREGGFRPLAWQTVDALKRRYGVLIGSPDEAALLLSPNRVGDYPYNDY